MSGLFRKKASGKADQLREKRTTFFTRQSDKKADSEMQRGDTPQGGDRAAGEASLSEAKKVPAGQNPQGQEKENYMIRCPKCGKFTGCKHVMSREEPDEQER